MNIVHEVQKEKCKKRAKKTKKAKKQKSATNH